MLADLVRTDRHNHRQVAGDSAEVEGLKIVARGHQTLIWARTRHTNMLRDALIEYYPAALATFDDLAHGDCLAVLAKAATPAKGAGLSVTQIQAAPKRGAGNATSPDEPAKSRPDYALHNSPHPTPSRRRPLQPLAPKPGRGQRSHRTTGARTQNTLRAVQEVLAEPASWRIPSPVFPGRLTGTDRRTERSPALTPNVRPGVESHAPSQRSKRSRRRVFPGRLAEASGRTEQRARGRRTSVGRSKKCSRDRRSERSRRRVFPGRLGRGATGA